MNLSRAMFADISGPSSLASARFAWRLRKLQLWLAGMRPRTLLTPAHPDSEHPLASAPGVKTPDYFQMFLKDVESIAYFILSKTDRVNHAGILSVFNSNFRPSVISANQVCLPSELSPELSKMYARFVCRIASINNPRERW